MLPVVVSPSNEGWVYLHGENDVNEREDKSLSLFGNCVEMNENVPDQFASQFANQTENIFYDLNGVWLKKPG